MFRSWKYILVVFTFSWTLFVSSSVFAVDSYAGLRKQSGEPGEFEEVLAAEISGIFKFSTSDPNGNGDDGGIVIKGQNGWWLRQFDHTLSDPIQLDWYQLSDGDAVSDLMINLAKAYSPRLYLKMPNSNIVLHHDSGYVNWSSSYGIREFALFESNYETAIKVVNPGVRRVWEFQDMDVLIIGTDKPRSSRDDYTFTLIGPWEWANRGITDSDSWSTTDNMVYITQNTRVNAVFHLRFDTRFPLSCSLYIGGSGDRIVYISGVHRYGGCLSSGGDGNVLVHFEDAYVSDELGVGPGWNGEANGGVDRAIGHYRGTRSTQVSHGRLDAGIVQITGEITAQYGTAGFTFFFVDKFGVGPEAPLVINIKDFGWTGPNELGKPVGIPLGLPGAAVYPIKSDGLGVEKAGWRFIYTKEQNQWGKSPRWAKRIWFAENAQCDDVANCGATYTTNTIWTYANSEGAHYYENGQHPEDRMGGNIIQGDGVNPAFINGFVQLIAQDTARFGQFESIIVKTLEDVAPFYGDGSGNVISNVTFTGKLTLDSGAGVNEADTLTFIGSPREVIFLASDSTLRLTNICAPAGSMIGGSGKLVLNNIDMPLPHAIKSSDCKKSNPDIPANPFVNFSKVEEVNAPTPPQNLTAYPE